MMITPHSDLSGLGSGQARRPGEIASRCEAVSLAVSSCFVVLGMPPPHAASKTSDTTPTRNSRKHFMADLPLVNRDDNRFGYRLGDRWCRVFSIGRVGCHRAETALMTGALKVRDIDLTGVIDRYTLSLFDPGRDRRCRLLSIRSERGYESGVMRSPDEVCNVDLAVRVDGDAAR